jgi:hypothetical protein
LKINYEFNSLTYASFFSSFVSHLHSLSPQHFLQQQFLLIINNAIASTRKLIAASNKLIWWYLWQPDEVISPTEQPGLSLQQAVSVLAREVECLQLTESALAAPVALPEWCLQQTVSVLAIAREQLWLQQEPKHAQIINTKPTNVAR